MRNPLPYAASVLCLVTAAAVWMVAAELSSTLRAVPVRMAAIQASIDALPAAVLPHVMASVDAAVSDADSRVKQAAEIADKRLGETLGVVKESLTTADARLQSIQNQVDRTSKKTLEVADGVRSDLKPVLENSAALVKNANDSWDSNYWDVVALLGSTNVAVTQGAQSAQTFNAQFPVLIETIQATNANIAGITGSVKSITAGIDEKFIHPPKQSLGKRILSGFKTAALTVAGMARLAK